MINYLLKRILWMVPILALVSVIVFVIIQLPPGDFITTHIASMAQEGATVSESEIQQLKRRFGLDLPVYQQYFLWIVRVIQGDFGYSFEWKAPVSRIIGQRLALTIVVSLSALLFSWAIALPIGIYSAVRQYSIGDYAATFVGFLGLATPNFMLALILMYVSYKNFGVSVGGLFSEQYFFAPWSFAKLVDLLKHLWIPMIVVGTAGTAGLIRIMRANLLDELHRPYVVAARARGLSEIRILFRYPVRIAINPFLSTIGWILPQLVSGATITAVVLSLPTTGPVLLQALKSQDMYLAGSFILMLSVLTVVGTVISDMLLAVADPRIRYE